MEKETEDQQYHCAWIDWANAVVSFQKAAGFEEMRFPTHNEMFAFVIEKSASGFRIQ